MTIRDFSASVCVASMKHQLIKNFLYYQVRFYLPEPCGLGVVVIGGHGGVTHAHGTLPHGQHAVNETEKNEV